MQQQQQQGVEGGGAGRRHGGGGGHWGAMVCVQERRGVTAAMSSVECGQCGHATGDHWHWRLYTDSPGSQAGCGGGTGSTRAGLS